MRPSLRSMAAGFVWLCVLAALNPEALAQTNLGVALTTSLTATQGAVLAYTLIITNQGTNAVQGVRFSDILDPNTTLVPGSVNTSPLAFDDAYSVIGNVALSIPAPGVLANDVDLDGVGPALSVTGFDAASARGGKIVMSANGGFTYDPPVGFEGVDSFSYRIDDGEGFTDTGKVSLTVTGVVWFVNAAAPAGGDGRLKTPFKSLASFAAINNNSPAGGRSGHSLFLYSGSYAGPLTLLNDQRILGQGAGASLSAITGLTPPVGSLAFPATGGARPVVGNGTAGIVLASGNQARGLNFSTTGGAIAGAHVGALTLLEIGVTNTGGVAVNLADGSLSVTLDAVHSTGGATGIRLAKCAGGFAIIGDGAAAENGSGGTLKTTTDSAVILDGAANVSLSRMRILNAGGSGVWGQSVNGLVVDWCRLANNGDAVGEAGIRLGDPLGATGLIGTTSGGSNPTRISNTLILGSGEMNLAIYNNAGTLQQLDLVNLVSSDTRNRPLGADGFLFETRGSAVAALSFAHSSFSNNFTQGIQASALDKSTLTVSVVDCGFTNNNEGVVLGNANAAQLTFDVASNRFVNTLAAGASGAAIAAVNATTVTGVALYSGRIRNNTIAGGGIDNHLIAALFSGAGNNTLSVTSNSIVAANSQFSGVFIQAGEAGSGKLSASVLVKGNKVSVGALGSHGIVAQSRVISTLCAEIAENVSTTAGQGLFGVNIRQRDASTFRLPGFAGPFNSTASVAAFVAGKNNGSTVNATVSSAYSGGGPCVLPLMAAARPTPRDATAATPLSPSRSSDEFPQPARGVPPVANRSPRALSDAELQAGAAAAREVWARSGISPQRLEALEHVRFEVADLSGWRLGESTPGLARLDRTACGYGWFVDPSPLSNAAPQGQMDLLSALAHEMGHQLGLADDYRPSRSGDVMYGVLAPGERRLPSAGRALSGAGRSDAGPHYLTAALDVGTLPPGKSLTIAFRAQVAKPMPGGVCALSNQATVSMAGAPPVLSDDPRTSPPFDATVTSIAQPPLVATLAATSVTSDGAALNGSVNSCGSAGGYYFEFGPTAAYGSRTPGGPIAGGVGDVAVGDSLAGLLSGGAYHFRVVATNAFGTSAGGDRVFVTGITILKQPQSVVLCVGRLTTFVVAVNVPGATYRWQRRLAGSAGFLNIPGASSPTFTVLSAKATDDGTAYRVVVATDAIHVTSDEAFLSVITVKAPFLSANFDKGLPANTATYGDAYIDAATGVLELNPNAGGRAGAFLTADPAPGRFVQGFVALFKARISSVVSPPADGFSFNWAFDLPNGAYSVAEEGEGSGLSVAFDTFDNGGGEAPAIDVFWKRTLVIHRPVPIDFLVRGDSFFDVGIRVTPDGLLDLICGCESVFARLPIPGFTPLRGARFGLGSRTGGLWETHGIDDLAIDIGVDPTNGVPRIDSVSLQLPKGLVIRGAAPPELNLILESSVDLRAWTWRGYIHPGADGKWEFVDADVASSAQRFYRLRSLPQFPSGLLNYYDADGSFQDGFGQDHGLPIGGIGFGPGERGQGFLFDTPDRLVSIQAAPLPVPWTLGIWVKRGVAVDRSESLLFDAATAVKLEQWDNSHQVGLTQFGAADYYFKYTAPLDVWTHLALVAVKGSTQLYVNGVLTDTQPVSINLPRGALGGRVGDRLQAVIDEVAIFGRALSASEILQVYSATHGP
ncbi:MAG: cadherin-like domain-containing protein [Verrucomicrobia bacterium]|nr:cadherin-like domain-containing protein [Verrucomicrobiota bacterium]MBI3868734.1 cadherin-like domain-containing protein [Verrucomicrobiota bacterium]